MKRKACTEPRKEQATTAITCSSCRDPRIQADPQLLHLYIQTIFGGMDLSTVGPMRSYGMGLSSRGVLFVLAVSFLAASLDCCMRARGLPDG